MSLKIRIGIYISIFLQYTGLQHLPWYNTIAFEIEICAISIVLIYLKSENKYQNLSFIISGILVSLCLLTKQDYGISLFFIVILLIYDQKTKSIILFLVGFSLILIIATIFLNQYNLWQQINFGSVHHQSHLEVFRIFKNAIKYPNNLVSIILILIGLIFVGLKNLIIEKKIIFATLLVCIQGLLTSVSSGLIVQTNGYFIVFGSIIIGFLLQKIGNLTTKKTLIVILIFMIFNSFGLINMYKVVQSFGHKTNTIKGFESSILPLNVKLFINRNQFMIMNSSFLNISELSPIYHTYQKKTPKNIPLWYDYKTTYFDSDSTLILNQLKYDYLLFEETHHKSPDWLIKNLNKYYSKIDSCTTFENQYIYLLKQKIF